MQKIDANKKARGLYVQKQCLTVKTECPLMG